MREIHLYKPDERPITAGCIEGSDWPLFWFLDMNFSKLTDSNQIFRNDFVCIFTKIVTKIIEGKIVACLRFSAMNSLLLYDISCTPDLNNSYHGYHNLYNYYFWWIPDTNMYFISRMQHTDAILLIQNTKKYKIKNKNKIKEAFIKMSKKIFFI